MNRTLSLLVVAAASLLILPGQATAQPASASTQDINVHCDSSITQADCALVRKVSRRLAAVIELSHDLHTWPPDVYVHNQVDDDGNPTLNAFAHPCGGELDAGLPVDCDAPEGQTRPHVHVTKELLDKLVQGREARLGFVLGHEMAHLTQGHTTEFAYRWKATSEVSLYAFGRQQEIAADHFGAQYGTAAGYDFDGMMSAIYRFIELDMSYSSFEGLGASHPSWEERLSFVNEERLGLWRAMRTFRQGVSLLATEQYALAEECFRDVVSKFPDSYDAHANLGYALLMQYVDQLEPADIERFGIGHIVVGAFTRRPESLEPDVRGVNQQLWFQAIAALQQAVQLNPDMIEARANLGVAYMVAPAGPDVARARTYFDQAVAAVPTSNLDNRAKAAIYINSGVANLAAGLLEESQSKLVDAERQISAFSRGFRVSSDVRIHGELQAALQYNAGLLFSNATTLEGKSAAVGYFENYLNNTSPSSNWWTVALAKYNELCTATGKSTRTAASFAANHEPSFRSLAGLKLKNGVTITLGDPIDVILDEMASVDDGTGYVLTDLLIEDTDLVAYHFFLSGTRVIATQEVLAIELSGPAAPQVTIRETGLGSNQRSIHIGMSVAELESAIGTDYEKRVLVDPQKGYRFYRGLGLAAHVAEGQVAELVITQIPYRQLVKVEAD